MDINSKKSNLILHLCQNFNADKYISGALGKDYLNENDFKESNIEIDYQDYQHPYYQQLYGDFLSNMSIVDFWMNSHRAELI